MSKRFGPYMVVILREMCRRVAVRYYDVDFKTGDWYLKRTWSEKEMNDFIEWMSDYLYRTSGARTELMTHAYADQLGTHKAAEEFVWNHGWKQKDLYR